MPAAEPGSTLRAVHRWLNGEWVRCRMYELRPLDVYRLENVGVLRAVSNPRRRDNGMWEIQADVWLDPATDRWEPVAACPNM